MHASDPRPAGVAFLRAAPSHALQGRAPDSFCAWTHRGAYSPGARGGRRAPVEGDHEERDEVDPYAPSARSSSDVGRMPGAAAAKRRQGMRRLRRGEEGPRSEEHVVVFPIQSSSGPTVSPRVDKKLHSSHSSTPQSSDTGFELKIVWCMRIASPARLLQQIADQRLTRASVRASRPFSQPVSGPAASDIVSRADMSFRIASEEVLHKRYITVYNRKLEVQRPGAEPLYVEYDVAGHPRCDFRFCVVRTLVFVRTSVFLAKCGPDQLSRAAGVPLSLGPQRGACVCDAHTGVHAGAE